ncbi:MAG: hypothetical protein HGN29_10390 [Asgard group archaeon]|nr:hypothetical protein [Asgard group archaeon]
MSKAIRIWDKEAVWPSVITVFSISLLAQIPHFYYLHEIIKLNDWATLPLLIAFPIFSSIGLSAVSLLFSEYLMNRVRDTKQRKLFRFLIRGSLLTITIYFVIQILIIFFVFDASPVLINALPDNVIDNITFKEILGVSLMLIIGIFVNPPIQIQLRRRK